MRLPMSTEAGESDALLHGSSLFRQVSRGSIGRRSASMRRMKTSPLFVGLVVVGVVYL